MSFDQTERTITLEEEEKAAIDPPHPRSCWYSRFWLDLCGTCNCSPSFQSIDVLHNSDGSKEIRVIDVVSSFSPPIVMLSSTRKTKFSTFIKAAVVIWKFLVLTLQVVVFMVAFATYPKAFWFGYLTNWALVFSMVYSALSFANTVFPINANSSSSSSDDPKNTLENEVLSKRAKVTWALFTLAGVSQMLVTVLYWILVHPTGLFEGVSLTAITVLHGGVCALILVDGLLVNRIPVRLRHWFEICLPVFASFVIWSVVQSPLGFDLDNPYIEQLGVDDDKIYPFLDWASSPLSTLALSLVCLFVVSPILHVILWAFSLAGRKYIVEASKSGEDGGDQCV